MTANAHRTNALVTSCVQRPVDPHTRAPLASYERDKGPLNSATNHADNRDDYEVSCRDVCNEKGVARAARGQRVDPRGIFFSNEEYYGKLERLKKAHLRTMAELESMYHHKLQLHASAAPDTLHRQHSGGGSRRLRKSHSAAELRRGSGASSSSDDASASDVEKGLLLSPEEFIKNMWADFKLSPRTRRLCTSLPGERDGLRPRRRAPGATVPKPFRMTLREAERRGVKTRARAELENAELRRQLEEMSECRNKFRASPVPAHVHLPLYQERLQERLQERRRHMRQECHLKTKPFSFLERERLKKQQQQQPLGQPEQVKPFKAKPVPRSLYAAAAGELRNEEQLQPSMEKQMRAREMLGNALANEQARTFSRRPDKDVPDFDAAFRRFQKRMEETKELKPTTACRPFRLRTARSPSRRRRVPAQEAKEPKSSHCSSVSGSAELLLPAKDTDATKKRHQAVRTPTLTPHHAHPSRSLQGMAEKKKRQALERRRRDEQEEARRTLRQKERQKTLHKRLHLPLTHTCANKVQEFRKQERQRWREYRQEMREMEERVKGRPLLLEQLAQKNAKQAARKRFADTLQRVHLSEDFVSRKAAAAREPSEDAALLPVHYGKVLPDGRDPERDEASRDGSEEAAGYSDHHDGDDLA